MRLNPHLMSSSQALETLCAKQAAQTTSETKPWDQTKGYILSTTGAAIALTSGLALSHALPTMQDFFSHPSTSLAGLSTLGIGLTLSAYGIKQIIPLSVPKPILHFQKNNEGKFTDENGNEIIPCKKLNSASLENGAVIFINGFQVRNVYFQISTVVENPVTLENAPYAHAQISQITRQACNFIITGQFKGHLTSIRGQSVDQQFIKAILSLERGAYIFAQGISVRGKIHELKVLGPALTHDF